MALPADPELSKSFTYLLEVEALAQEILTVKEEKFELANTLNKLRESLRALQVTEDRRTFLKVSSLFIECPTEECIAIVQREIDRVNQHYNSTAAELRNKLAKMRDLEHEPEIKGIGLKPLSYWEAKGLMKGFGID